ncbi:MAG: copper amine oxidase N-terminal domain-containing protein [Syntrophomonadaceae bacterium]
MLIKRRFCLFVAIILVLLSSVLVPVNKAQAKDVETVFIIGYTHYYVDDVMKWMDVAPYINNGRTYLPIAYVAQALGITDIQWDEVNRTVTLTRGQSVVKLTVDSPDLIFNGFPVAMGVAPEIKMGRMFLPVSLVVEGFGGTTSWDSPTQTVFISCAQTSGNVMQLNDRRVIESGVGTPIKPGTRITYTLEKGYEFVGVPEFNVVQGDLVLNHPPFIETDPSTGISYAVATVKYESTMVSEVLIQKVMVRKK